MTYALALLGSLSALSVFFVACCPVTRVMRPVPEDEPHEEAFLETRMRWESARIKNLEQGLGGPPSNIKSVLRP